ncbi:MAG TPA: ABC transporter ATP-binding protein [Bryobacteraceae bacterium]|nr:ABC transporter ATP-binding protein [Bryobacteraceae bacterium]
MDPSERKGWRDRAAALRNIPPVLKLLWDSGHTVVAGELLCRVLTALVPVATYWVAKTIIDMVVAKVKNPAEPFPQAIWFWLAAEFGLACMGNVLGRAIGYFDGRIADNFSREVSLRIMRHAARLDLASFEDPVFYDKLERARVQATDRINMLNAIGNLIQQFVTLASLAIALVFYNPLLLLFLVVCVVPSFLGESHFAFLGYSLAFRLTPLRRELDYLRVLGTSRESAKEMKIFGLAPWLRERFSDLTDTLIDENKRMARRRLGWGTFFAIVGSLGYYGAYAWVVIQAVQGRISVGELQFLINTIAGSAGQIQAVFSTFTSIADQALFLTDLLEFFAMKPGIESRKDAIPAPRPIRQGFEFQNVGFHYPGVERQILKNLNFRIEPGERIALVGANGQGKTTFVKLMARLYDPTEGRILLDGVDLRDYDVDSLQREIGIIFQDFVRYDMLARTNIGVGRLDHLDDEEKLREAAHKSRADEILRKLPRQFDQMLGRRFEGGVDLSGGEWQKFALARAYLRDAQVLILDEPTAALDAVAEYEVFRRFSELTEGRMAILISHRFSTVRMSDRIVVLEDGAIREQGTHEQLVTRGGKYAEMFELQAANYR